MTKLSQTVVMMTVLLTNYAQAQEPVAAPAPTPAPVEQPKFAEPVEPVKEPRKFYFAMGVGYSSANTIDAPNTTVTVGTRTGSAAAEYSTNTATTLTAEGGMRLGNGWGLAGGYQYDTERSLSSAKITSGGITTASTTSGGKIQLSNIYVNGTYNFSEFYLYLGMNSSIIKVDGDGSTCTPKSMVGAQLGGGYKFTDNISAELGYRNLNAGLVCTAGTTTVDYGSSSIKGVQLGIKYFFF